MKLSAVVNCHNEGKLAWRSLSSAWRAIEDLDSELIIMLDCPDKATEECAKRFKDLNGTQDRIMIAFSDHKDLGLARNTAVSWAKGEYVAFLDADDIWGVSWPKKATEYLDSLQDPTAVAHPQLIVNFEHDELWWQHTDSRRSDFEPSSFFITNHWTAHCMAKRDFLFLHPYKPVGNGFGFEDWEWNSRTLAEGSHHVVVPETVHFIRKQLRSMSRTHVAEMRVIHANKFFDKPWQQTLEPEKQLPPVTPDIGEWIYDEWKTAHIDEPELWPSQRELVSRQDYYPPAAPHAMAAYFRVKMAIPDDGTHLIMFAGHGGGADKRVEAYAQAIRNKGGIPVLVATDKKSRVAGAIEAANAIQSLDPHNQTRVVQRLMVQFAEKGGHIHIVNSRSAWASITMNTQVFKNRLFVSLYAFDYLPEGKRAGYAGNGALGQTVNGITKVITDNPQMSEELRLTMGLYDTDVVVAMSPALPVDRPKKTPERLIRVLWASRVDWNKNADWVYKVAMQALRHPTGPILFDFYGDSIDHLGYTAIQNLRNLPNVTMHNNFKDWTELEPGRYDMFMQTSLHEGYPNTVVEALAHGLPVISSPAGGLAWNKLQSLFPGKILEMKDPEEWCQAIRDLAITKLEMSPQDWVRRYHSQELFEWELAKGGYFANLTPKAVPAANAAAAAPSAISEISSAPNP